MFVNKIVFGLVLLIIPMVSNILNAGVEPKIMRYQISDKEIVTFLQKHVLNLIYEWKELSNHRMTAALFRRNIEEAFGRANVTNKQMSDQCKTLYEYLEMYFGSSVDYLSQKGNEEFLEFHEQNIAQGLEELCKNKSIGIWKSDIELFQAVIKDVQQRICDHLTTHEYYEGVPPFLIVVEALQGEDSRQICNVHIIDLADASLFPEFDCSGFLSKIANISGFLCSFGALGVSHS